MRQTELTVSTHGTGLYPITQKIVEVLNPLPKTGLLNCFLQHTSASLVIQENADLTARQDLETFLDRLVPENQPWHRHTLEGPDDTTSHLKAAITATSLNIPIVDQRLGLGTWQGVYLWEHRKAPHVRRIVLTVLP